MTRPLLILSLIMCGSTRAADETEPSSSRLALVEADVQPASFFFGPIPRTESIAADATLHDVACVGRTAVAVGDRGVVTVSTDGGQSWTSRLVPFECSLRSACFLTDRVGWIAGFRTNEGQPSAQAVLLETRDGGESWRDVARGFTEITEGGERIPIALLPGIQHIQFFGLEDAVAVTQPADDQHAAGLFRSTDGGQSWTPIATDRPAGQWLGAAFPSPDEGVVVGTHRVHAAIVSNQAVVINPPQPTLRALRGVSLESNGRGWIVGDGAAMLTTENSGITWQPPQAEVPELLRDVLDLHTVAQRGSTVLMAGNPASLVLRSATDGRDWQIAKLPSVGRITRLRFQSETDVLAVGSFGRVLRSHDAGLTWQAVRSASFRAGILNLVTEADRAAWPLLAQSSGDAGIRSVVLQLSQSLDTERARAGQTLPTPRNMSAHHQQAVTELGGNEAVADWMFARSRPELHLSTDDLIAEWNRQTDGQLRQLLPLRLARDIRNWRPAVIVIEPAHEPDAVTSLLREVLPLALRLAATDDQSTQPLADAGLAPWTVQRIVARLPEEQISPLIFDEAQLLPSLGTTTGLMCDHAHAVLREAEHDEPRHSVLRTGYEVLHDAHNATTVDGLFDGLQSQLTSEIKRAVPLSDRDRSSQLEHTLQQARLESAALRGQPQMSNSETALIAEVQQAGANLPATLALKQLRDLGDLNLERNNIEGWLAIQQELTRRFPKSPDARAAAEMLFLFYSSAELRHQRLKSSQMPLGNAPRRRDDEPDAQDRGNVMDPVIQKPDARAFADSTGDALRAVHERWDNQALTAWSILSAPTGASETSVPALARLRHAANLRLLERTGEHNSALAELSSRTDLLGLFARSEMQVAHQATDAGLPLINLPQRSQRPFLDAELSDAIWEDAQELQLQPFVLNTADPDSPEFAALARANAAEASSLVMLAWDAEYLYVAARLEHPRERTQAVELAAHRRHDDPHESRDRLELEIDTDRDLATAFHLTIDESGRTSDRCWLMSRWNPQWFAAVTTDDETWRVEAAIPLAELSSAPVKPGDLWSIKLRRVAPGLFAHELRSETIPASTRGTALLRFIRARRLSGDPSP